MIRSPAVAIGWQVWRRNRGGVIASLITLAVLAVAVPATVELSALLEGRGMTRAAKVVASAAGLAPILPLFFVFASFMNGLLFTEEPGNISSGYPRRMFTLPVRSRTLALWPMFYAAAWLAATWVATAVVLRPAGVRLHVLLPSLGLAAAIISLQAVAWMPFGHSWARVALCGAAVPLVATPPLLLTALEVWRGWVAAVMAAEIAAATAVAAVAVRRDRRGDVWRLPIERLGSLAGLLPRSSRRRGFRSALEAQVWYDWRCHGLILPVTTAATATLILLAGAVGELESTGIAMGFFGVLVAGPMFLSGSLGGSAGRMQPMWVRKQPRFAFIATKPITSGTIATAKFRMAGRAAFVTAGLAAGSLLLAAAIHPREAAGAWRAAAGSVPGGALTLAVAAAAYPLLMWKQATDALPSGLIERRWVSNAIEYTFAAVAFALIGGAAVVYTHPPLLKPALASLPWVVACAAVLKGLLAGWAYREAVGRGLITRRFAFGVAVAWSVAAACVAATVWALVPEERLVVGRGVVIVAAVCFVPLARFALAPLAIDWNRHR